MGSAFCFIILSVIVLAAALYLRYRRYRRQIQRRGIVSDDMQDLADHGFFSGSELQFPSGYYMYCFLLYVYDAGSSDPAFCTENRGCEEIRDPESGNFLILYQCSASGTPELSGDFPVYTDAFCNAYSFVGMGTDLCHTSVERIQKRAETGDPYGHDRIYDSRSLRDCGIDSVLAAEYFLLWNHLWNRNPYFPDPDHSGYNCKHGEKYPLPYRNAGV